MMYDRKNIKVRIYVCICVCMYRICKDVVELACIYIYTHVRTYVRKFVCIAYVRM